jgi:hypothetical protein
MPNRFLTTVCAPTALPKEISSPPFPKGPTPPVGQFSIGDWVGFAPGGNNVTTFKSSLLIQRGHSNLLCHRLGVGSPKSTLGNALRSRSPCSRIARSVGVSGGGPAFRSYSRSKASVIR